MIDPASLTGKVLWLRAKDLGGGGSSISSWPDQSGLSHNGTSVNTAPTVAATSTPLGGKSVRFAGTGYFNLGSVVSSSSAGEIWIVVKSDGGTGPSSWEFGNDMGLQSHFPYSGVVYDDAITNARQSFTPTMPLTSWRIYRVANNGTTWVASLDGQPQLTLASKPVAWPATFLLGTSSGGANFQGNIAEVYVRTAVSTTQESSDLLDYFVKEHFSAVTSVGIYAAYAEATTLATSPPRALYGAYAEALSNTSTNSRQLYGTYTEAVSNNSVINRQLFGTYTEVLTSTVDRRPYRGWGLAI